MFSTIYGYEGRLQVLMRNLITCPDLVCDPLTLTLYCVLYLLYSQWQYQVRIKGRPVLLLLEGKKTRKKQWSMTNVYQVCLVFLYWHLSILSLWLSHLQGKCRACLLSSCNLATQSSSKNIKILTDERFAGVIKLLKQLETVILNIWLLT